MDPPFNGLGTSIEILKDRLYFLIVHKGNPKSTSYVHYFTTDNELVYEFFYEDFGPLNLAHLYRFSCKLNKKLTSAKKSNAKIVYYTSNNDVKRANAAFLIGSYMVIYFNQNPEDIYRILLKGHTISYRPFRDASIGECTYDLTLLDCFKGVAKAVEHKFLDFSTFDLEEYEYYEKVENGDFNWLLPGKFLAFCGPHQETKIENGYPLHSPATYFKYFRDHNVQVIVRLNKKVYDAQKFCNAGFKHFDLFFTDGSNPSDSIMFKFLEICESTDGAIAVHCKAGLGRTGTLIGCYLMKHYFITAAEAIAWMRICRPGSVIGPQQHWLEEHQDICWREGRAYKERLNLSMKGDNASTSLTCDVDNIQIREPKNQGDCPDSALIDAMLDDSSTSPEILTQGDQLNLLKARRKFRSDKNNSSHTRNRSQQKKEPDSKVLKRSTKGKPVSHSGRLHSHSPESTDRKLRTISSKNNNCSNPDLSHAQLNQNQKISHSSNLPDENCNSDSLLPIAARTRTKSSTKTFT